MRPNALTTQVLPTNCSLLSLKTRTHHTQMCCGSRGVRGLNTGSLLSLTVALQRGCTPWNSSQASFWCCALSPAPHTARRKELVSPSAAPSSPAAPFENSYCRLHWVLNYNFKTILVQSCPQTLSLTRGERRWTAVVLLLKQLLPHWWEHWFRSIILKASSDLVVLTRARAISISQMQGPV